MSKEYLEKEIKYRLLYFYGKTDGSFDFPNSAEGDLLKLVNEYMMSRNLASENAELRKDKERLDRLQSSHLALYCSTEGEVWRKEGIYKIREYIDEEMEDAP